jgi:general secretion pathway protein D
VGITLKITPQISKDRMVRLDIYQEVTKVDETATLLTTTDRPTTLKRTIDTTVIVKDNSTVVIGGLIDDAISKTVSGVPCLADIPIMGYLFKTTSEGAEKTNLFVFLTPRVVQNPEEASEVFKQKKIEIDTVKEGSIKMYKMYKEK